MATRQGYQFPGIKGLPSEYFRKSVFLTFIDEPDILRLAHDRIGVENLMWSPDYPHPVSSWPKSQMIAQQQLADATDEERDLILWGNSKRVWNL